MRTLLFATLALFLIGAPTFGLGRTDDEGLKLLRQGLERLQRGDYEGALARFRDAQIERPESREIHFNVGMALYKLERYEEARAAFEAAARAADLKIEKTAIFHVANCYVKEGKLQEALDAYNRALALDADYADAKQNREWVVRKMKELARKQKEREEKAKEERRIIEKLQEIIKTQTEIHGSLRVTMKARGLAPQPSRIAELAQVLDQEPTGEMIDRAKELTDAQVLEAQHEGQAQLAEDLTKLIDEARTKIEAGAQTGGGQPGGGPGDPEIPKLEKAIPHLEAAEAAMTRAVKAAGDELDFIGLHAGQEIALESLLRALDELLDELTRLIKDQAMLLKDGFEYARLLESEDPTQRPDEAALRDTGVQHGQRQKGLRDRAEALAKGMDGQLQQQREQATQAQAPGGQGTQPGQDPEEMVKKLETALGHMNAAADHMEQAEVQLMKPDLQNGLDEERQALDELVKARAALQPPPEGGNQKSEQQEKKQGESQDGEQPKQDGEKGEDQPKPGEQGEPKDSEQKPQDGEQGQEEGDQRPEMSEEQAKKTLERARQRELDRRRDEQDEQKRLGRGGKRKVEKDW